MRDQMPSSPDSVIPESDQVAELLRSAKEQTEALAQYAKQHLRPLRNRQGALLYNQAAAAYNTAITRMIVALGKSPEALPSAELNRLLANADARNEAFFEWYDATYGEPENTTTGDVKHTSAVDPIKVALAISGWLKLEQELNRGDREALRRELNECKWRGWDEL